MAKEKTEKTTSRETTPPAAPMAPASVVESAPVYRVAPGVALTSLRGIVEAGAIVTRETWAPGTFDELVKAGKVVRG